MLRRAISTLALTALLAAPAAAQVQSPFWFEGDDGSPGIPAPYGEWRGSFESADGAWFQVFCVDFDNTIGHDTDAFNVWVTPFGAADQSHLHSAPGYANYIEAAQFASLMVGGGGFNEAEQTDIQRAIWYTMGFGTAAQRAVWVNSYNSYGVAAHAVVIDPDEWIVISWDSDFANANRTGNRQELIAFRPSPPQEIIPEPATMTLLATGLAGMAAARRRRKS